MYRGRDLWLNVCNFSPAELIFVERNATLLQIAKKPELFGTQNQQRMATPTFTSGRSANSMDILLHITDILSQAHHDHTNSAETATFPLLTVTMATAIWWTVAAHLNSDA